MPDFPDVLLDSGLQIQSSDLELLKLAKFKTDMEPNKRQSNILYNHAYKDNFSPQNEPHRQKTPELFSATRAAALPSEIGGNSSQIKLERCIANEIDNIFELSNPSTVVRKFEPAVDDPDQYQIV